LILTAGQVADVTQGAASVEAIPTGAVIADKGYDSDALVGAIEATGAEAIIPPQSNRNTQRKADWHRYKARNLVERFFNRLKQFRRIPYRNPVRQTRQSIQHLSTSRSRLSLVTVNTL
jgi:transposase